jgi:hypothetical protein
MAEPAKKKRKTSRNPQAPTPIEQSSAPVDQSLQTVTRFLDLPAEIRLQIYECLFAGEHLFVNLFALNGTARPKSRLQSILATCRLCSNEAHEIFYSRVTFVMDHTSRPADVVRSRYGHLATSQIQRLGFLDLPYSPEGVLPLQTAFPALKTILSPVLDYQGQSRRFLDYVDQAVSVQGRSNGKAMLSTGDNPGTVGLLERVWSPFRGERLKRHCWNGRAKSLTVVLACRIPPFHTIIGHDRGLYSAIPRRADVYCRFNSQLWQWAIRVGDSWAWYVKESEVSSSEQSE